MFYVIAVQLREWAGPMQAPGLFDVPDKQGKFGLVHNVGLGGAVVVSLLRRPEFYKPGGVDGRTRRVLFYIILQTTEHFLSGSATTTHTNIVQSPCKTSARSNQRMRPPMFSNMLSSESIGGERNFAVLVLRLALLHKANLVQSIIGWALPFAVMSCGLFSYSI